MLLGTELVRALKDSLEWRLWELYGRARELRATYSTSHNWICGLPFAAFGAAALAQSVLAEHGSVTQCLIAGGMFLIGLVLILARYDLRMDLVAGSYQASRGVWPFVKRRRGLFTDFHGVALRRRPEPVEDYEVTLLWQEPQAWERALFSGRRMNRRHALMLAEIASERTSIPLLGEVAHGARSTPLT